MSPRWAAIFTVDESLPEQEVRDALERRLKRAAITAGYIPVDGTLAMQRMVPTPFTHPAELPPPGSLKYIASVEVGP